MMAVIPYPGELYILNKLLDGIIDVNGERSVEEQQKLFVVGTVFDLAVRFVSLIPSALERALSLPFFLCDATQNLTVDPSSNQPISQSDKHSYQ